MALDSEQRIRDGTSPGLIFIVGINGDRLFAHAVVGRNKDFSVGQFGEMVQAVVIALADLVRQSKKEFTEVRSQGP